ncbi:MAG: aminotransferase class V-fold PLP-dependent enzyme [Flavobacteriales bacterium]
MMSDRRHFLQKSVALTGAIALPSLVSKDLLAECTMLQAKAARTSVDMLTQDEDFWWWVRQQYTASATIINLNNGGVAPQPKVVQDAHIRYYQMCNEAPSYYMWQILDQGRESLRSKLADLAGCDADEVAINRNSTEGLNTIIFGLNLKAGDEVVLTKYDYPNMINAWKQREKREGIVLKWIDFELPQEIDDYFVNKFSEAITDRTKVVHITHMINWTGQILPSKKIADLAHTRGCEVIVDGAHSFAHFKHTIPDTGADYYATSLHKWLSSPFGSGLLYIKKEKIKDVWALLSNDKPDGDNIRKFESLGTRSFASEMAIAQSVDFFHVLGAERKEARLRYLKNYWAEKLSKMTNVSLNTSMKDAFSCAIGNFSISGWKGPQIAGKLMELKKVHSVGIEWEKVNGVRITPNVYSTLSELDQLIEGIEAVSKLTPPTP